MKKPSSVIRSWLAKQGRKGGKATSAQKAAAARANGKKGGRPKRGKRPLVRG